MAVVPSPKFQVYSTKSLPTPPAEAVSVTAWPALPGAGVVSGAAKVGTGMALPSLLPIARITVSVAVPAALVTTKGMATAPATVGVPEMVLPVKVRPAGRLLAAKVAGKLPWVVIV